MKREGGIWASAAVLGMAATLGISSVQTRKPSDSATPSKTAASTAGAKSGASKAIDKGPCADLEKHLQAFLLVDDDEVVAPASCFPDVTPPARSEKLLSRATPLRFVIATLPDPLHTHFPLYFDRTAEAIQQAAQDENYVYDSSWMPWETEQASYERIADQDEADERREEQEDQPGILLFRRSFGGPDNQQPFERGLVVLVVGEEPTGGIHRRQFQNAVHWIEVLQRRGYEALDPPVQILGPTFSGSIPSLVELLKDQTDSLSRRSGPELRIFSGSVTSNTAVTWLDHATRDRLSTLNIEFRSFEHSSNHDLERYCRYLEAAGTDLTRLAIVSEDETAFGSEFSSGGGPDKKDKSEWSPCQPSEHERPGPVHLYYPRDISAVRAAYQTQSIFTPAAQPGVDTVHHTLQTDLADPAGKEHDTIRAYGGSQSALSQEAELQQIVSLLRAHSSEYVLLRSSNPLDQLFLSHYFRMTYPEGRIVIVGAEILLRRETGASGLNGVMTLSTYPLLPWEQDWTKTDKRFHSHRVFAFDGAEGLYMATRFLLHSYTSVADITTSDPAQLKIAETSGEDGPDSDFVPANCPPYLDLPDYALPFWTKAGEKPQPCHTPPTWLSVLGTGGFWPVAVLDFRTHPDSKPASLDSIPTGKIPELGRPFGPRLGHSFTSILQSIGFALGFHSSQACVGGMPQAWPATPLSLKLSMVAVLLWAIFHAFCCWRASITVKPAHRAHFVRPACHQNSHCALVLLGSILVMLAPTVLAWGYGAMWEGGEPLQHPWPYRVFLPLIWLIACVGVCGNAWVEEYLRDRNDIVSGPLRLLQKVRVWAQHIRAWARKPSFPVSVWLSLLIFTLISLLLYWLLDFLLDGVLNETNRIPTYLRAINLNTGVSPLVPLLALVVGLYGWFWYALQGLALLGEDRPLLPAAALLYIYRPPKPDGTREREDDLLRMLSWDDAAIPLEELGSPWSARTLRVAGICFTAIFAIGWGVFGRLPIRSLGATNYSLVFCFWLALCISLLLANSWQLLHVWLRLRHMLLFLDKMPLRRTMKALRGFSWGSVWKMSGSVLDMRYKLIFRQLESLTHLRGSLLDWDKQSNAALMRRVLQGDPYEMGARSAKPWIDAIDKTRRARVDFARWYSQHWDDWKARDVSKLRIVQQLLADTAATVLTQLLIPAWRDARETLLLDLAAAADDSGKEKTDPYAQSVASLEPHIRNAEELVCLVYMGFIQNVLGRMRSIVMSIICVFIAITIAVSSYPFDPRALLSGIVVVLFALVGAAIIVVYTQMHRDATLSNLTDTKPGELGSDFWIKLIGFGAGPVLGLIASVFPEFTDFLFSWIQPGIASVK